MQQVRKIRVLIVDDSLVFREILARGLSTDPRIEVVGRASDAFEARDKILETNPDIITCDIQMPRMNGIEFIRRLLSQYPIPVIVVSSVSDAVFDAMSAGAVDFVAKPDERSPKGVESIVKDLIAKIVVASKVQVRRKSTVLAEVKVAQAHFDTSKVIGIGASTGGTEAIYRVLKALPANIPGIAIVQHIPPVFSGMFAQRMNTQTALNVKEAENGDFLDQGCVLIAPGDKQMQVRRVGDRFKVEVFEGEKVSGHCPSVDVMFDSMAKACGDRAVGVLLTGMGQDGAHGLVSMRKSGAFTIGQDEKSCVVYGMPKIAYDLGGVERQLSLDAIPGELVQQLTAKH
jgi:two-component system, chemotaxis family, protein-glutamate methylesterase/glutaminase